MTAGEVSTLLPTLLPQRATVYGYTTASGTFATVTITDLRCRIQTLRGGQTQGQRADLLATRSLLYDAAYPIPDGARVLIEGVWYDPIEGTDRPLTNGVDVIRAVDMVRLVEET